VRWEGIEEFSDALPCGFDGAFCSFAQEQFEFCEDLLDRVEIGAVGWEEQQLGTCSTDRLAHRLTLVAAEVVHDDDVARRQGGHEELLDVSREERAVDRTIEHAGRIDPVATQCGHKGQRLPFAERGLGNKLPAALRPASDRRHVGLGPGLIDEDQSAGIKPALILLPLRPAARDLRTILLRCEQRFF